MPRRYGKGRTIYVDTRCARVLIKLTNAEWRLLLALALARGTPLTFDQLFDSVYPDHLDPPLDHVISVLINRLRNKLSYANWWIDYLGWRGYALRKPPEHKPSPPVSSQVDVQVNLVPMNPKILAHTSR